MLIKACELTSGDGKGFRSEAEEIVVEAGAEWVIGLAGCGVCVVDAKLPFTVAVVVAVRAETDIFTAGGPKPAGT